MSREQISPIRNYESVYILKPDATEEVQKEFFQKNKSIIEKFKGEVHHVDTWGQRHLANEINKYNRGTYFHMTFKADPTCIQELERTMRINDSILRFHHHKLDGRITLDKHMENYKQILVDAKKRAEEKEARSQARRSAGGGRDRDRGDRDRKPRRPAT